MSTRFAYRKMIHDYYIRAIVLYKMYNNDSTLTFLRTKVS